MRFLPTLPLLAGLFLFSSCYKVEEANNLVDAFGQTLQQADFKRKQGIDLYNEVVQKLPTTKDAAQRLTLLPLLEKAADADSQSINLYEKTTATCTKTKALRLDHLHKEYLENLCESFQKNKEATEFSWQATQALTKLVDPEAFAKKASAGATKKPSKENEQDKWLTQGLSTLNTTEQLKQKIDELDAKEKEAAKQAKILFDKAQKIKTDNSALFR